jgi:exopolyphosphatase/guanosine-5'-triphosphate,3'-diphosphate pyrophosphatase
LERTLADSPALSAPPIASREPGSHPPVAIGAAIDIGSNSVHLLVGLTGPGWVETLRDTSDLLGLGDTVDQHTEVPLDARHHLIEVLHSYVEAAHRSHADRVTLIGTEPLRRAGNVQVLADEIRVGTGLELRVLTEREEAILTFVGVTRGQLPDSPLICVDIGGGSTEVSRWTPGQPLMVDSLPFGSSRLTAAMVVNDPPTDDELDRLFRATADVAAGLDTHGSDTGDGTGPAPETRAIFVGGTATNVARLGRLTRQAIAEDRRTLSILTASQVSTRYNVKPRRARQLGAGIAIVDALLGRFGIEGADVSDASLRDGAIIAAVRYGDRWPDLIEELIAP